MPEGVPGRWCIGAQQPVCGSVRLVFESRDVCATHSVWRLTRLMWKGDLWKNRQKSKNSNFQRFPSKRPSPPACPHNFPHHSRIQIIFSSKNEILKILGQKIEIPRSLESKGSNSHINRDLAKIHDHRSHIQQRFGDFWKLTSIDHKFSHIQIKSRRIHDFMQSMSINQSVTINHR